MQLYAFHEKKFILAADASKGKDYLCPECSSTLRVRGGNRRQLHFFHLKAPPSCKQHQKGEIHLKLQLHLQTLLADEDPRLEFRFPQIDRIADVACLKSKKIFEIQYSPISFEEAQKRTQDYESLGFQVIWVLHDHQFNKRKLSPAESYLRTKLCYFTDFDKQERGIIYDQLETVHGNRRVFRGPPIQVDVKNPLKRAAPFIAERTRGEKPSIGQKIKNRYSALLHLLLQSASE